MRSLSARTGLFLALAVAVALPLAPAAAAPQAPVSRAASSHHQSAGRGTLVALPPIVQPGKSPAGAPTTGQVLATFDPARPGSVVMLDRKTGSTWKQVARKRQDTWGSAAFAAQPGTYRARTETELGREVVTGKVASRTWSTAFQDTFSAATLDAAVWSDQKRERESVYAPRTCARTDPSTRRVEGGVLHLGVGVDPTMAGQTCHYTTPEGSGDQSYLVTSQIATENSYLFTHGIAAARIKPQQAKGMHSGFWMLPQDSKFTEYDPSAGTEVDIMEFFGQAPSGRETIGSFVSYYEPGWKAVKTGELFSEARQALGAGASWWDEFHVFSMEWTPESYIFRVDGREYYREARAVSMAQQYLVLSMLSSDYELSQLTADELSQSAEVDWVQVWDATSSVSGRAPRLRTGH